MSSSKDREIEEIKKEIEMINNQDINKLKEEYISTVKEQKQIYEKELENHKNLLNQAYNTISDLTKTISNFNQMNKVKEEEKPKEKEKEFKDF